MTELAIRPPANWSFAVFLVKLVPSARRAVAAMPPGNRPACLVATFRDDKQTANIQLTGRCEAPRTKGEIGLLFDSLPSGTMIAWFQ